MQPQPHFPETKMISDWLQSVLQEDIGDQDITTQALIDPESSCRMQFTAREDMVVAGLPVLALLYNLSGPSLTFTIMQKEGAHVEAGQVIATIEGNMQRILTTERVALNLLQHLSGIASLTARYVEAVQPHGAAIYDTRKTTPGMRVLEKYAVTVGGGHNHRMGLYDAMLIKDNHLAEVRDVEEALSCVRVYLERQGKAGVLVQIECDTLEQAQQAIAAGADALLLDNMTTDQLSQVVKWRNERGEGQPILEASGNVSLQTVAEIAATNVDRISIGALTHSARNVDIGLDEIIR